MIGRALVLVCAAAVLAAADPTPPAWKVTRGTLAPGRDPRSFVLASDGAPGRYSEATMLTADEVTLPYRLAATWRRLGPEAGRSMHVFVAGGVVLIKSGAIAFYPNDDAGFAWAGWTPLPGHAAHAAHALVVRQDRRAVEVTLDGAVVARFSPPLGSDTAHVGFGMKSAPGLRSAIYLRDVAVEPAP